jgi:hypothetical protein
MPLLTKIKIERNFSFSEFAYFKAREFTNDILPFLATTLYPDSPPKIAPNYKIPQQHLWTNSVATKMQQTQFLGEFTKVLNPISIIITGSKAFENIPTIP